MGDGLSGAALGRKSISTALYIITESSGSASRRVAAPWAVVKADAYGHGDGYVSRALQQDGADWFAVSNINEAVSLRRQGVVRPVLILGYTPPEMAGLLVEQSLTQTVYSGEYARALSKESAARKLTVDCHIKIDTGMSRIGFFAQQGHAAQAANEIARVCALPGAFLYRRVYAFFVCR